MQGTLLYDVRDTGQDVRYGVRFSVTNAETGFHSDNSFGEYLVDYVGLLCIRSAKSGGVNQVVSAYTLGGFIHLLLVVALVVMLIRIIQGRSPVV